MWTWIFNYDAESRMWNCFVLWKKPNLDSVIEDVSFVIVHILVFVEDLIPQVCPFNENNNNKKSDEKTKLHPVEKYMILQDTSKTVDVCVHFFKWLTFKCTCSLLSSKWNTLHFKYWEIPYILNTTCDIQYTHLLWN